MRDATVVGGWALAYFCAHVVAFYFPGVERIIMAVWPAGGIGLAALLLSPRAQWRWLLTAFVVAGVGADVLVAHRAVGASIGYMAANIIESVACALLILRVSGEHPRFDRVPQVVALLGGALGVNAVTACLGAGAAVLTTDAAFGQAFATWYVADGLGILLVAPLIVTWAHRGEGEAPVRPALVVESAAFFGLWCVMAWSAVNAVAGFVIRPYMVFALLAWPAFRMPRHVVPSALALLALIGIGDQVLHPGISALAGATPAVTLLNIQVYLAFAAATGYMLMASFAEWREAALAARDSEADLKEAERLSHVGHWTLDVRRATAVWSDEMLRIWGLGGGVVGPELTQEMLARIHPEDRARVEAANSAVFSGESFAPFEYRLVHPNGEVRTVAAESGTVVRDAHGQVVRLSGVVQDITERKRAEAALRSSELRWQFGVEGTGDGLWDWDLETNTVYFSPTWKTMLGHSPDEIGDGLDEWSSRVHPDELPQAMADVQDHVSGRTPIYQNEHRVRCRDGTWKWILDRGVVAARDADGRALRMIGTHRDISERRAAAAALSFASQQLLGIVEGTRDVIAAMDVEYRYTLFNTAFRDEFLRIYGRDLVPGDSMITALAHLPHDLANARAYWDRALGGEDFIVTQQFGDAALARRWYELHFSPVRDAEGAVRGAVHVVRDVTDQKRAERDMHEARERAESANRAKSEFLANMSHEIRTPLNGVLGNVQLLEMSALTAEQHGYLEGITLSGNNLLSIINDILDLSKIEADRTTLERAPFGLRACLHAVVGMQRVKVAGKGLAMVLEVHPDVPQVLVGDELRIKQVLLNLVSNAAKFTERGSITVVAKVREDHGADILLDVSVTDTGVGIPAAAIETIFDPFVQADTSITRRFGGTGLGLSISRRLVELMGGSIAVESTEGAGSCFRVLIPLAVGDVVERAPLALAPDAAGPALRILVAEDHDISRQFAGTLLARLGHAVTVAADGRAALEALERAAFDVVLMDLQMPVMDGFEVLDALRRRESAGAARTPVIAVTAYASKSDERRCLEAGFDGFVSKPIHAAWLSAEMHRVLGRTAT